MDRPPRPKTAEQRRADRLAAVLSDLMARANLRQSELARRSGISAATLTNLLRGHDQKGKPTLPTPDLLRDISLGLATNGLGERNIPLADQHYVELLRAIGYLDAPSLVYAPPLPADVLELLVANPGLIVELGRFGGDWVPEDTELLREQLNSYHARSVQRQAEAARAAQEQRVKQEYNGA